MIQTKDILASLPLLASVLGDKYNVRVRISGDKAYTNGNTIYIPAMPLECDTKLLSQVRGFIDHESAHIRHTDFEVLALAHLNPTQQYLFNALEDWRVENAFAKIFLGSKKNFQWLIHEHFGKTTQKHEEAGVNPASSLLSYILLAVRTWDVPSVAKMRDLHADILKQTYSCLLPQIDSILSKVQHACYSTQDAVNYALELYALMEEYLKSAEKQKSQEKEEKCLPKALQSTEITEENTNNIQGEHEPTGENMQALHTILHADTDALPKDMGQCLATQIMEQQATTRASSLLVAEEGQKLSKNFTREIQEEVLRSSRALRTRLHGLLQAQIRESCAIGRRGKVCSAKLYGIASHNPRIFLKQGEKRGISTAVHLLLDCSGSMSGIKMQLASQACYSLALALEQNQGINVAVTLFPAHSPIQTRHEKTANIPTVLPLIRHGQKVHGCFQIEAHGHTPLAESLWWVMQQMYPLKEERKIILILSDGMPDSIPPTKYAIKEAQKWGFEVMGLGIEDDSISSFLPHTSRTLHSLPMLAPTLFGMLQQTLLHNGIKQ